MLYVTLNAQMHIPIALLHAHSSLVVIYIGCEVAFKTKNFNNRAAIQGESQSDIDDRFSAV